MTGTPDAFHVTLAGLFLGQPLPEVGDAVAEVPPTTAGVLVWRLAADLQSRGVRVSVVTLDESAHRPTMITASGGVPVWVGPRRSRHRMRDLERAERNAVRDGVRGFDPDIVHAHWCYEYALGALASGVPTLVTAHDWIPAILRYTSWRYLPYWSGRAVLYFRTLAQARHVTAVSPYSAAKVRRFTRAAVEVIPNGIDDGLFVDRRRVGSDVPTADGPFVFLSVNNGFSPRKNVKTLLRAFAVLRARRPRCELWLAGSGFESSGVGDGWARARGLEGGVTFLGSLGRDDLLETMRSATALVHPAREENMPLTVVEAMASGLPVIGGAHSGGLPWVLHSGAAGLLVDIGDPGAIADAMEGLVANPDLGRRVGEAGYRHAEANFRQSRVTDLYLDAYRRVLAECPRRGGISARA